MAKRRPTRAVTAAALSALALSGAAALPAAAASSSDPPTLRGLRERLDTQTTLLVRFTATFEGQAARYYALAKGAGFDYRALWHTKRPQVRRLLADMKTTWIAGNPLYERMEGIVAGVPSLARYDVVIDAGASGSEDPASAVPFDLTLPDGRVIKRPGNFYNITGGALSRSCSPPPGISTARRGSSTRRPAGTSRPRPTHSPPWWSWSRP